MAHAVLSIEQKDGKSLRKGCLHFVCLQMHGKETDREKREKMLLLLYAHLLGDVFV